MVMLAVMLLLTSDPAIAVTTRDSAAASTPRPITIARLPLRSIADGAVRSCTAERTEPPRRWTPEKDVIGTPADSCWGQAITVVAPGRAARLPVARATGSDDNDRMRLAMTALPYLRGVAGGGAMAVALTGRLMLARGSVPEMHLDLSRGRAGATSYVTAPDPEGLTLGRPDRF